MAGPLYFVRHGETDWNRDGRLQGQRDVELNAAGRRQAAACGTILGDLLRGIGRQPDEFAFVSSPLSRALETMALMRRMLGLDPASVQIDPRLKELSFGDWEGEPLPRSARAIRRRSRPASLTNGASSRQTARAMPASHNGSAPGTPRCGTTRWRSPTAAPRARLPRRSWGSARRGD